MTYYPAMDELINLKPPNSTSSTSANKNSVTDTVYGHAIQPTVIVAAVLTAVVLLVWLMTRSANSCVYNNQFWKIDQPDAADEAEETAGTAGTNIMPQCP